MYLLKIIQKIWKWISILKLFFSLSHNDDIQSKVIVLLNIVFQLIKAFG